MTHDPLQDGPVFLPDEFSIDTYWTPGTRKHAILLTLGSGEARIRIMLDEDAVVALARGFAATLADMRKPHGDAISPN